MTTFFCYLLWYQHRWLLLQQSLLFLIKLFKLLLIFLQLFVLIILKMTAIHYILIHFFLNYTFYIFNRFCRLGHSRGGCIESFFRNCLWNQWLSEWYGKLFGRCGDFISNLKNWFLKMFSLNSLGKFFTCLIRIKITWKILHPFAQF